VKLRIFGAALLLYSMMSLSPIAEAQTATVPTSFRVGGQVASPSTFDLAKLKKLPTTSQNVTYFAGGSVTSHEFTGALLWDLLQSVGIKLDQSIKNDILHKVVVVTGSDGYETVFGAGEIDPGFGGEQIAIAYAEDGQSLGQDGFAKIIAPGDKMGGRFVSNIVKIEVRDVR
jgi:DMSO/TMAO reductase YedYZ molybdopterin-dependent catalytic subunit